MLLPAIASPFLPFSHTNKQKQNEHASAQRNQMQSSVVTL
jgi:hypothetical protein